MKLFGKKTLAMLLTIAMAMSICSVSALAANDNTTGDVPIGSLPGTSVVTGLTASVSNTSLIVGQTATITTSVQPAGVDQAVICAVTAGDAVTLSDKTVTAVKAGTATVSVATIAKQADGTSAIESITFTVTDPALIQIQSAGPVTNITVPYGFTASELTAILNAIDIPVTYTNGTSGTVKATWTAVSGSSLSAAVGSTGTYRANITNTISGFVQPTVNVTVGKATIVSATAIADIKVPVGATGEAVAAKFPKNFKVKLQNNSERTLTVGTDLTLNGSYDATATTAATYTFTASLKDTVAANYTIGSGVNLGFNVKTVTSMKLSDISVSGVIEGDEDVIDTNLENEVYAAIRSVLGKAPGSFSFTSFSDLDYGSVSKSTGNYTVDLNSEEEDELYDKGSLSDKFSYTLTVGGVTYTGDVYLTMYTSDVYADFGKTSGTLSTVASAISTRLKALHGSSYALEDIYFDGMDLEGGDLYTDSGCDEEVLDDEVYTASELSAMYYVPNGTGEYSSIDYVAYGDEDGDHDISGTIYLFADEFMIIQAQITTDETLKFSADEFEDAFLDLDSDYYELTTVAFTSGVPYSANDGYVYYDGDTKVKSGTTKYYVEPSKSSEKAIDDLHYEPGKKGGVYSISFTAIGYDDDDKKITVTGIYQITVTEVADITIKAGKGQTVEIDPDLFADFLDEKKDTTDIAYVIISGAPYQAKKGYLVTDGDKLTKSGDKTFYADEEDVDVSKKKYDLYDLYFQGGSSDNTVNATFKIYYLKSNGKVNSTPVEGTVDFITGSTGTSNTLTGVLQASRVMTFGENATLEAFESLGGNNNEYIVFSSLPVGGKLVYNWGKSGQEDVQLGTEYYLSYKAGKKLMSNISFVPSYSASKTQKTITIGIKGFNSKGKATLGTINLTVNHAATSAKFYDITTSTYADSVDFLYYQGITTGMTETTFGPNNNVTRAQFVTFLWRAAGSPSVTGVANKFTDVKSTGEYAYAYQAILWAVQNNITTGRSATSFAPAANVTHQELLTFLYRYDVNYLKHSATASSYVNYTDYASVADYAQTPVKWADYKGILDGYAIQPTVAGTRATVALWLHRMLTL